MILFVYLSITTADLQASIPSRSAYRKRICSSLCVLQRGSVRPMFQTKLPQDLAVRTRLDGSYSTNSASPEANYAWIAGRGHLQTRRIGGPPDRGSEVVFRPSGIVAQFFRGRQWFFQDRLRVYDPCAETAFVPVWGLVTGRRHDLSERLNNLPWKGVYGEISLAQGEPQAR